MHPEWISTAQVIAVHDALIMQEGGSHGLRDKNLLESALNRAPNAYAYGELDICMLAALVAEGIARNHAFIDGNKRTCYAAADLFLFINGLDLQVEKDNEQKELFENLAQGKIGTEELAEFYRINTIKAFDD